jgi:hypothetical protein
MAALTGLVGLGWTFLQSDQTADGSQLDQKPVRTRANEPLKAEFAKSLLL